MFIPRAIMEPVQRSTGCTGVTGRKIDGPCLRLGHGPQHTFLWCGTPTFACELSFQVQRA
jgi:hypothetical protein